MSAEVFSFPSQSKTVSSVQWAEAWAGIVRMMEANGRGSIEISLAEAKRIAALAARA